MTRYQCTLCGLLGLLLLAAMLTGCGKSDSQRATDTAHQFLDAMRDKDEKTAQSLLTNTAREKMGGHFTGSGMGEKSEYHVEQAAITGDNAEVPVVSKENGKETHGKIKLRREEKEWRVYALTITSPEGMEITLDFEHPEAILGEMMKAMGEGMAAGMRSMGKGLGEGVRGFGEGLQQGLTNNKPTK